MFPLRCVPYRVRAIFVLVVAKIRLHGIAMLLLRGSLTVRGTILVADWNLLGCPVGRLARPSHKM
jgi:hypothetical protein